MKLQITNYTFDKTAKTVTFTDYTTIRLDSLLLITNVTDNIIIYNFASSSLGGTVLNNVLTLDYDTSSMDNTDSLQIFYDDSSKNSATSEKQSELNSTVTTNDKTHLLLQQIRDAIRMTVDLDKSTNSKRVIPVGGTVTTVTTVATVTNQTNIGGFSADMMTKDSSRQSWGLSIRSLIK